MRMLPVHLIDGNHFLQARELMQPAIVADMQTFIMPPASRDERDHTVRLDSAEGPTLASCTCEAFDVGAACWAMARALDVLALLAVNKVYVSRAREAGPAHAAVGEVPTPLVASVDEAGGMSLMCAGRLPAAAPSVYATAPRPTAGAAA